MDFYSGLLWSEPIERAQWPELGKSRTVCPSSHYYRRRKEESDLQNITTINCQLPGWAGNGFIEKHNLPGLVELTGANWPIFENWLAYCLFPMCLLFRSIWFLHFESPALTSREFLGAETPTSFENNSNEICNKLFTDSYHPPLFSQLIMWKLWFHSWGLPAAIPLVSLPPDTTPDL